MKIQIFIALAALCLASRVASAQSLGVPEPKSKEGGVQLKKTLEKLDHIEVDLWSYPGMKTLFDDTRPDGVKFFTSPEKQGFFTVTIVRQDSESALRALAKVMGVRIVIDPEIKFSPPQTRALTFNKVGDDIFGEISRFVIGRENIEMWKSAAGTYFFAAKAAVVPPSNGPSKDQQAKTEALIPSSRLQIEPSAPSRHPDPFVLSPGVRKPVVPQPSWEKREFNGRAVYFIPVPTASKPKEQKP